MPWGKWFRGIIQNHHPSTHLSICEERYTLKSPKNTWKNQILKQKSQTTPKLSKTRSQKKNLHLKKIKKRRYNHQANTIVVGVGIVKNEQSRNQPQVRHNQSTNQAYKPQNAAHLTDQGKIIPVDRTTQPATMHSPARTISARARPKPNGGGSKIWSRRWRINQETCQCHTHTKKKRHAIGRGGGETSRSSLDRSERRRRQRRRRRRRRRRANGGMRRRRVKRRYWRTHFTRFAANIESDYKINAWFKIRL